MPTSPEQQFVDPQVTRSKFDEQVTIFKNNELDYRKKGIFLLECEFPNLLFMATAPQLAPPPILYGIRINFTNYNVIAPSVKLVHPHTGEPLLTKNIRSTMPRLVVPKSNDGSVLPPKPIDLLQTHGQEREPFICLPGIREYHDHPAHTGDSWLLHKDTGEGTLDFILDKIWLYGITTVGSFTTLVQFKMEIPEMKLAPNPERIPG